MPFKQFKDLATILAIVVFPTPLIPVNKYAFADLSFFIELKIVCATTSWHIKSLKVLGLYLRANTFELLLIN